MDIKKTVCKAYKTTIRKFQTLKLINIILSLSIIWACLEVNDGTNSNFKVSAEETNYDSTYNVSTAAEFNNAITEINQSENGIYAIELGADIDLTNTFSLIKNSVTIFGEDHTLSFTSSFCDVSDNATLNLGAENYTKTLLVRNKISPFDSSGSWQENSEGSIVSIWDHATLNMYSGVTLTGQVSPASVAGIDMYGTANFNMYAGEISNCQSQSSGTGGIGIHASATFTMSGGTIKNCSGGGCGGVGVYWNGNFVMNGGTIESCNEDYYTGNNGRYGRGGGVTIFENGKFTMNGGTIKDCKTWSLGGGGVYVISNVGTTGFEMNGGEIKGCNAKGYTEGSTNSGVGGGVFVRQGLANITAGSIYNNNTNLLGDDIFSIGGNGKLKLCNVQEGLTLSETNYAIDGWYVDGVVNGENANRWDKDDLENAEKYTPSSDTTIDTQIGLKAAHGISCAHVEYNDPTYIWSEDCRECTAKRVCKECGYEENQDGTVTSEIIEESTCTTPGTKRYKVTFTNPAFLPQTKDVEIHVNPDAHSWNLLWIGDDENGHYHTCSYNDVHHSDIEHHNYGEPTYVWSNDYSTCTAERVCTKCGYKDSEQVVTTSETINVLNWQYSKEKIYTATFTKTGFEQQNKRELMMCSTTLNEEEINCILQDPSSILSDDVYLKITAIEKDTDRWNELTWQLDYTYRIENLAFFEIELLYKNNDEPVRPMPLPENIRVLLQIPEVWDKENLETILVSSGVDREFEEEIVTIDSVNYIAFWTNHFSPYAVIDKLTEQEDKPLEPQDSNLEEQSPNPEPKDSDLEQQSSAHKSNKANNGPLLSTGESNLDLYITCNIILVSFAALMFVLFKKKRKT